jgi:hypothetical protein
MFIRIMMFIACEGLRWEAFILLFGQSQPAGKTPDVTWWRRGELNPCPRRCPRSHLHVYPALRFREPTLHRRTAVSRASTKFLHRPARSLRRTISLLSTFGAVAGVQLQTSRSIKPRERDLGDLRLFVLARFFTRPTNHPRHAACASNHKSKPVRPHFGE